METRQIKGYENLYEITEFGNVFAVEGIKNKTRYFNMK